MEYIIRILIVISLYMPQGSIGLQEPVIEESLPVTEGQVFTGFSILHDRVSGELVEIVDELRNMVRELLQQQEAERSNEGSSPTQSEEIDPLKQYFDKQGLEA